MMDALEYGRIIHAEMNAITDAARLGKPLGGSILYSTTFPCHMCAKHIVSSGITEVVFLEPYPKSLAEDLHNDSIEIEGSHRGKYETFPKVRFTHFYGITPRSYMKMFARGKRKADQDFIEYIDGVRRPNVDLKEPTYIEYEKNIIDRSTDNFKHIIPEEPPEQAPAIAALIKVIAPAARS